jgi:D-alanine-D-alanine ligase
MDKAVFKAVLRDAGIPVAPGAVVHTRDADALSAACAVGEEHGWPVFVKPASLGSSIGISRVTCAAEMDAALNLAFQHDRKVVVEAAIEGVEVECGVLGNEDPLVSIPGEVQIAGDAEWYDFETKYAQGRMDLIVPARISDESTAEVQAISKAVFQAIDCTGLARIDSFVTPDGKVVVNEVNTMPGFTATSAYAKLFEASGYSYNQIVDQLIQLAIDRHREQSELRH